MTAKVKWPSDVSVSADFKDFVGKLLEKSPHNRLGSDDGADEILEHAWLEDVDIDLIDERNAEECPPPFIPDISNQS